MKITKAGTIEFCCVEALRWYRQFIVEDNTLVITDIDGQYVFSNTLMNYCPFCGSRTEVEK